MATNTFATTRGPSFNPRTPATYTWPLPMMPENRFGSQDNVPWTHGTLAMTGWVRNASVVAQRRVVELLVYPSMQVVARTYSDAANAGNNYFFNGLSALPNGLRYVLQVYNEDGSTAARIKDNRTPV
jgi:hypothetical protein